MGGGNYASRQRCREQNMKNNLSRKNTNPYVSNTRHWSIQRRVWRTIQRCHICWKTSFRIHHRIRWAFWLRSERGKPMGGSGSLALANAWSYFIWGTDCHTGKPGTLGVQRQNPRYSELKDRMESECLADCWVCEKSRTCKIIPDCSVVFEGRQFCQMISVCKRKHNMCLRRVRAQNELRFEDA